MPPRSPASDSPPRRRLSADEARARILAAAERKLMEVGPDGLRLAELAAELGISHPAILHHFGRREDLIGAVAASVGERFQARLRAALEAPRADASGKPGASDGDGSGGILAMIGDFFDSTVTARLMAWLVLSKRAPRPRGPMTARPLRQLIDLAHTQRNAHKDTPSDPADTEFRSLLIAYALLGEALFGDLIRPAAGLSNGPTASRDFRRRLAALLNESR